MKVVTLSRKPCGASSTTANVVEHQAGALNIDACRIGTYRSTTPSGFDRYNAKLADQGYRPGEYQKGAPPLPSTTGRWPANVILVHRAGCEQTGTTVVPGYSINRWKDGAKPFGGGAGHEYESEEQPEEEVAVWKCVEECPVRAMGDQSGAQRSPDTYKRRAPGFNSSAYGAGIGQDTGTVSLNYGDAGTAARYFKQVQSKDDNDMEGIPQELIDYLTTMISPPPSCEPVVIVQADLHDYPWEKHGDTSVHGLITTGNPEPHMEDIDRVLRPGAHLLILSPEDEPTGHTGACAVEDFGYEIRDAIAVLDTPGEFHYVAKASSAERNAGVVQRESGTGRLVQNDHATVKPVAIMEALLGDVPDGALVVDAFMGSGTTGIACLRTGHSFVGIDQDAEYLQIADQRIRHWDRTKNAWNGATIESEAVFEDDEPVGIEDLFGFGGDE